VKLTKSIMSTNTFCDQMENSSLALDRMCEHSDFACPRTMFTPKPEFLRCQKKLVGVLVQNTTCVVRRSVMPYQLKYFLSVMSIESCAVTSCHNAHNQTTTNRYFTGTDIVACLPRHRTAVIHSIL
jgi:hypothetical protein